MLSERISVPVVLVGMMVGLCLPAPVLAQAEENKGEWIIVRSPITDAIVKQVQSETRDKLGRGAKRIVYEFKGGDVSEFPLCLELADFILRVGEGLRENDRNFPAVQTYAFIDADPHRDVKFKGHATLPALACRQLYMAATTNIGFDEDALRRSGLLDRVEQLKVDAYLKVIERRGRIPGALVVKMLDIQQTVLQFNQGGRSEFRLGSDRGRGYELKDRANLVIAGADQNLNPKEIVAAGRPGFYTVEEAESYGLCDRKYGKRQDVLDALGIPGHAIQVDIFGGKKPVAAVIEIKDEVGRFTRDTVRRKMAQAIERGANLLIFQIESTGGDPVFADDLAKEIQALTYGEHSDFPGKRVMTVAYVPGHANGASTFVALACKEIVMGPEAELGDCESLVFEKAKDDDEGNNFRRPFARINNRPRQDEEKVRQYRDRLGKIAERNGYSSILVQGLMDPDLVIMEVANPLGGPPLFKDQRALADREKRDAKPIKPDNKNKLLVFETRNTNTALQWGIARHRVENTTNLDSLAALYGFNVDEVIHLRSDWLDALVNILISPVATIFLVIVGFTCLILELKAPGMGLPAIIAATCFILLFWAHTPGIKGGVNWLAILMFLLGLVLLGIEIFVLPGFGVTGISGIVLLLLSLSLVVVQKWPTTGAEYGEVAMNFGIFSAGLIVSIVAAYMLARLLPSMPMANKLMLPAPSEEESAGASGPPAQSPALLGAIGVAVTQLRPAGKARFGEEFIDVVAEGHYVEAGGRVQVIEIDGLKVVVKAL